MTTSFSINAISLAGFNELAVFSQASVVFVAGFLTCLTPCVYPLIPIILAIFAGSAETNSRRTLLMAGMYVSGMAITYALLGLLSGAGGLTFGFLLANPAVLGLLVLFLAALALHSLGLYSFPLLASLQNRASRIGGQSPAGAMLMGAASGVVAAPCVGPVLVLVLSLAASSQDAARGALLLLLYALGLGLPLLVLAMFSGLLSRLPRSGSWMQGVNFAVATALLLVCAFLFQHYLMPLITRLNALPAGALLATGALAILLAIFSYRRENKPTRLFAACMLVFCLLPGFSADSAGGEFKWHSRIDTALQEAVIAGKPVVVDFYADWCGGCKELGLVTFRDKRVQQVLKSFVLARVDFTLSEQYAQEVGAHYNIPGLPLVLFLDSAGNEFKNSRLSGYIPPDQFAAHLQEILDALAR